MMKKVQYLFGILAIILILVFAQHHFLFNSKKNSAYNYISRQIGLNTKKGLLTHPKGQKSFKKLNEKLTKVTKAQQMPSQDTGQEMVKGKYNRNPCKIRLKDYIYETVYCTRILIGILTQPVIPDGFEIHSKIFRLSSGFLSEFRRHLHL